MLKKAVGSYVLRKKVEANWLDTHTHRITLHTYPIKDKGACPFARILQAWIGARGQSLAKCRGGQTPTTKDAGWGVV